jgi:hypothetical protein
MNADLQSEARRRFEALIAAGATALGELDAGRVPSDEALSKPYLRAMCALMDLKNDRR